MTGRMHNLIVPLAMAGSILAGLVLSLMGDGLWDVFGWIGTALPLIVLLAVRRWSP